MKKPSSEKIAEHAILKSITDWFVARRLFHWRNYNGPVFIANGRRRTNPNKGIPDLMAVTPSGRLVAVEVKTKTGRLSDEQKVWIDALAGSGAIAFVATSIDDVIERLKDVA